MTKVCSCCGVEKDLDAFRRRSAYDRAHGTGTHRGKCKDCRRENETARAREYRERNPAKARESMNKWKAANPERLAFHNRQRRFLKHGIGEDDFLAMVSAQNGRCAICRELCGDLHIDHNHATGAVRELLCGPCNRGLGHFRENAAFLRLAVAYLARH